jgi:hypothetical protein
LHAGQADSPNNDGAAGGSDVGSNVNNPPEIRVETETDDTLSAKLNNRLSIKSTGNNNDSEYNASAESNASSRRSSCDYPQYELRGRFFGSRIDRRPDDDFEIVNTDSEVGTRVCLLLIVACSWFFDAYTKTNYTTLFIFIAFDKWYNVAWICVFLF